MESSNGMNVGVDMTSSPDLAPAAASSVTTQEVNPGSNERIFKQSELDSIVKREKQRGYDAGVRSAQTPQNPTTFQGNQNSAAPQNSAPQSFPLNYNEDYVRQIAAEEAGRTRDQIYAEASQQAAKAQWDQVTQTYEAKIQSGKEKYKDFDTVTDIDMTGYPAVKQILAQYVDNSADVLYALGKDRFRLHQLEAMGRDQYHWKDAIVQAKRLAESIKENESAAKVKLPNEPLSQMRPSPTSMDSGSNLSHRDLRAKYRG